MIKCTFHLKLFQFDKDTQNKLIYWYPTFFLPCKTLFFTGDLIQKFQNVQFRWVILPVCDRKIGNSQVKLTCNHGRQTHFYLDLSISSQLGKFLKKNINIGKIIIMLFYEKKFATYFFIICGIGELQPKPWKCNVIMFKTMSMYYKKWFVSMMHVCILTYNWSVSLTVSICYNSWRCKWLILCLYIMIIEECHWCRYLNNACFCYNKWCMLICYIKWSMTNVYSYQLSCRCIISLQLLRDTWYHI